MRFISDNGLDGHVTFTGFRSDVQDLLGLLDLFVLPSYREGAAALGARSDGDGAPRSRTRTFADAVRRWSMRSRAFSSPAKQSPALAKAIGRILADPRARRTIRASRTGASRRHVRRALRLSTPRGVLSGARRELHMRVLVTGATGFVGTACNSGSRIARGTR